MQALFWTCQLKAAQSMMITLNNSFMHIIILVFGKSSLMWESDD